MAQLTAKGLTLFRGDRCLFRGVGFALNSGELLILEGSNGSGKTSLMKAIVGMLDLEKGVVSWNGMPVAEQRQVFHGALVWTAHRVGLKADLTLVENLRFEAALRPHTRLVSIMHANNELGTLNDIAAIGELCRERKIIFHVDAAQSAGKIDIDLEVDSLTPIAPISERLAAWTECSGREIRFESIDVAVQYQRLKDLLLEVQPDAVVHFAEQRAAPYSMKGPKEKMYTVHNNLNATHNVLCAVVDLGLDIATQQAIEQLLGIGLIDIIPMVLHIFLFSCLKRK